MELISAFAVPIGKAKFKGVDELNNNLKALFLNAERHSDKFANKNRNSLRQREVFESHFELFNWDKPEIYQLKKLCMTQLISFVTQLSKIPLDEAKSWNYEVDAWFHITRNGGYFTTHNHPNASWSAVYCVSSGDNPPNKPESGVLRMIDFKANAAMYIDAANIKLQPPFGIGNMVFKLTAGDFIIFPSYLLHEVAPYWGETERITVAMNCWFKDPKTNYPG